MGPEVTPRPVRRGFQTLLLLLPTLFSVLPTVDGRLHGQLFGAQRNSTAKLLKAEDEKVARRVSVSLPSECSVCGSGLIDPFGNERKYCNKLYSQCKCCKGELEGRTSQICSQFMGYGSCVAGIKAAIKEEKARCSNQQALDDHNDNAEKQKIRDALGYDPFDFHAEAVAEGNSTVAGEKKVLGPYDEACSYGDPNCKSNQALCAHGYGCNYMIYKAEVEYRQVKGWYELYINTPCFR